MTTLDFSLGEMFSLRRSLIRALFVEPHSLVAKGVILISAALSDGCKETE